MTFLKKKCALKKIFYFSAGAVSQYKNRKSFANFFHQVDFGVEAKWHYFRTSHGESSCDGVVGILKRLAAQASLQKIHSGQILSATDPCSWAANNLPEISVAFVSSKEYDREKALLAPRSRVGLLVKDT